MTRDEARFHRRFHDPLQTADLVGARPKPTECDSETGKTVGLIDAIINSFQLLLDRDLKHAEVKEALKDLMATITKAEIARRELTEEQRS
jgi:hypothetical protein